MPKAGETLQQMGTAVAAYPENACCLDTLLLLEIGQHLYTITKILLLKALLLQIAINPSGSTEGFV